MNGEKPKMSKFDSLAAGRRRAVRQAQEDLVRTGSLESGGGFPLVLEPNAEGVSLSAWAADHREELERRLLEQGAILFRGFGLGSVQAFEEVARAVTPDLLDYRERAAPRREVGKNLYTSTEFPADQWIPLHHEMSYSHNWPTRLWFYCDQPAREGGRTPLVDDRGILARIDPEIRRRFLDKKVMYVRNYGEGVDLPWQQAFQTEDRSVVEDYCRRAGMAYEWRDRDRLRTRTVRQVVVTHPETGNEIWFNHAHMFHVSNLTPEVRQALLAQFEEDELPRNAFYGDGSPIEDEVLEEIRRVYREAAVAFTWQQGDLLWVDNFLVSHGREPFAGPRRIIVAMADLYTDPALAGNGPVHLSEEA
jgi:alpha-ketoglutarate-dependent taurine dioxygenase